MTYDPQNIFARILRNEIPSKKVYEDDTVLAFHDISQAAPVHVLVIPKAAYTSFSDFTAKAPPETIATFFQSVHKVIQQLNIEKDGYRLITNHGPNGSQSVPHFHVHILAGRQLGGLVAGDAKVC
jgi:histidine triad (HIT) family protein